MPSVAKNGGAHGPWTTSTLLAGCLLLAALLAQATPPAARPRLLRIYDTADPKQDTVFALDSYLTLEVTGLSSYLRAEEALLQQRGLAPQLAHTQAQQLVLYINDAPLIGMPPESMHTVLLAVPPADSGAVATGDTLTKIIFHLTRRPNTYAYWNVVYDSPWQFSRRGTIGLGYADRVITNAYPEQGPVPRIKLVRRGALAVALLVVALLATAILLLAHKSWLLRNSAPNWIAPLGQKPMFSLAKSQLAWWTFLVLGSYLLIYCVTGQMTNISTTTLELLGISAGTAGLGSVLGVPAPGQGKQPPVSRGWWLDLLSDDQGVSIHRLQQVGFTLLLGYLFVRTVYKTVALPDWNENEILLLGISSATYLGLKAQENKQTTAPAPPTRFETASQTAAAPPAPGSPAAKQV